MVVFPELSRPRTRILASCFLVFLRFSIMPKRPFLCVVIYHYVLNTGQINETVLKKRYFHLRSFFVESIFNGQLFDQLIREKYNFFNIFSERKEKR